MPPMARVRTRSRCDASECIPNTVRARRITCRAWQPTPSPSPLALYLPACLGFTSWIVAYLNCLLLVILVVASGVNLPVLVAAASSVASGSASTTTSSGSNASSTTVPTAQPHVLLISLPWRGHVMPLRNVGARLVERGFHVTFAVATEESKEWLAGSGIDTIQGGNFKACSKVRRQRERQPRFPTVNALSSDNPSWNTTLHDELHPGAQLVDLFAAPSFAWQSTEESMGGNSTVTSASGSTAPNGISTLMRVYTDFQSCMYKSLLSSVQEMMDQEYWDERWEKDSTSAASETSRKGNKKSTNSPSPVRISPPRLLIIDRFTFAGMDVAMHLGLPYVINNPHVLLDLDSPSWSLPAPWSYLPPQPPLGLVERFTNLAHRFSYRATMYRILREGVNKNRLREGLQELKSWEDYTSSSIILTNTIWGIELHRSADAQGMHSHRNVNVQANGYTPRFKMTGPLLPTTTTTISTTLVTGNSTKQRQQHFLPPTSSIEDQESFLSRLSRLRKLSSSTVASGGNKSSTQPLILKKIVYINLGDGEDLTPYTIKEVISGLQAHQTSFAYVWSLPHRVRKNLLESGQFPKWILSVGFMKQYEFLSAFKHDISAVITHGSLSNIQESLSLGLPLLLLPHPSVEQYEITTRFLRTGSVYVLQRVQLDRETMKQALEKVTKDESYSTSARQLSGLFLPSSSQGTSDVCTLIELAYRVGWSHLYPFTANPDAPLPFYRDFFYSLPLDIYGLYVVLISILVFACKQLWALLMNIWNGEKKW